MDRAALLNEVGSWTVEERLEFIDAVYDQLVAEGWFPDLVPEVSTEIERRLAEYEKDPSSVITWDEVEARLEQTSRMRSGSEPDAQAKE